MNYFRYFNDSYVAEDVPLATIAENVGTPCYVYSRAMIERHWHVFDAAFEQYPHRICYSVKANSNLAVLDDCVANVPITSSASTPSIHSKGKPNALMTS